MTSKAPNLTVFRDRDDPGAYTWSPFVVKLEARLRFSHLTYTTQAGSLGASPKGKLPYVRIDEDNGQSTILSDTALITKSLVKSGAIKDLNANLTPAQAATDLAIRALLEDKLYFLNVRTLLSLSPPPLIPPGPRTLDQQLLHHARPRPTLHNSLPPPPPHRPTCLRQNNTYPLRPGHRTVLTR